MVSYSPRIVSYFCCSKPPSLLLIGEAPGPKGADCTGYPFWGDDAGLPLYSLVGRLGLFDEPFTPWQRGENLSGTKPPAGKYAITNACTQMPVSRDGRFRAPPRARLDDEARRVLQEINFLQPAFVLACGRSAAYTLARAALIESSAPPAGLERPFSRINLRQAIEARLSQNQEAQWRVAGSIAFVTAHPARSQWAQSSKYGGLHAAVVSRLRRAIQGRT